MDLQLQIKRVTLALRQAFSPDHFNYAFLQNQDRHVHMHIILRYAGTRHALDMEFNDPDYPPHYSPSASPQHLSPEKLHKMEELLKRLLEVQ